jgi:uncharacterized protein (TIGR03118 family)
MKWKFNTSNSVWVAGLLTFAATSGALSAATLNVGYLQTNLISDLAGVAKNRDPRALNSWGIVAGPGSIWVSHNHGSVLVGYNASGAGHSFAVNVPAPGNTGGGAPTGLELNRTLQFNVTNGVKHAPATFLIATEDGTILAWNFAVNGTNAVIVADRSGADAIYKGLAIVRDDDGAPLLFAADFHNARIDVFDGGFNYVTSFTDTNVPAPFAPFNVSNIRGRLFVTFAKQGLPDAEDDEPGPGNGYVDIFDTDGTVLRRFASEGDLNSPWGLAVAPRDFGKFSHALLVGNFGDGRINAYDLLTGKHLGHLTRPDGSDLVIEGLWGLAFDRVEIFEKESLFTANRLYFTAGPNDEDDGLVGYIRPLNRFAR